MKKENRREFLKKLMLGSAVAVGGVALANNHNDKPKSHKKNKANLYDRTQNWELYYKQAN